MNIRALSLFSLLLVPGLICCDETIAVINVPEIINAIETPERTELEQGLSAIELETLAQIESLVKKIETSKERKALEEAEWNLVNNYTNFDDARTICLKKNDCDKSIELKEAFYAFNQAGIEFVQAAKKMDEKEDTKLLLELMKRHQNSITYAS